MDTCVLLCRDIEVPVGMTFTEISSILRLDDIMSTSPQTVDVLHCSAIRGDGLSEVVQWLETHASHN